MYSVVCDTVVKLDTNDPIRYDVVLLFREVVPLCCLTLDMLHCSKLALCLGLPKGPPRCF